MPKIAVIGTTSWGTTLAVALARQGREVVLWARTAAEANNISQANAQASSPESAALREIPVTADMAGALAGAAAVLLVVPSQTMRQNIRRAKDSLDPEMLVVSAAKGLELGSNKRMTEVIAEEIPPKCHPNICVLSGPNLSGEIMRNLPAATVIAAASEPVVTRAQKLLTTDNFCVYTNTDVIGVELGGAFKNILALGAGMVDGLECGDNTKAAFITRGLIEITALGVALGASPLTFSGLAGIGDVYATCASNLSRNHNVGVEIAKGRPLEEIRASMNGIAEGVTTTRAARDLARSSGIGMPVVEVIYRILFEGTDPRQLIREINSDEAAHELSGRNWELANFTNHNHR